VIAKSKSGSVRCDVNLTILAGPPSSLRYNPDDATFQVGEAVTLGPEIQGSVESWAISPELPPGMDFRKGVIEGIPTQVSPKTTYVITASNAAGSAITDVILVVIAPKPMGLAYPHNGETVVGTEVSWEPTVEHADCATYTIEPPLPVGLMIHPTNGTISGTPEVNSDMITYTITAENIAGSCAANFDIFVDELRSSEQEAILRLAVELEECTGLGSLPAEPNKGENPISWMLWMVHRAYLNDPALMDFNFTGLSMPLPDEEPLVSPKLMKAMAGNTHIVNLDLANSNLQRKQGGALAESLGKNSTLRALNVESNCLDLEALTAIANSLTVASETSALEVWKFSNQRVVGTNFGRAFEAVASNLVDKNKNITKLGFSPQDRHWLNQISKALLRNVDLVRRRRNGHLSGGC
jgi:hypothetical protein